ncbi:unnamed protein product [Soboliphyme baturini]|uniref:Uncharacterized protein n=1 Tax=Soboliphyme baturini TaxID=241478 RepID=A0A183IF82_9BILA|nr:unnamed protein product [Soboliphyme baturini]
MFRLRMKFVNRSLVSIPQSGTFAEVCRFIAQSDPDVFGNFLSNKDSRKWKNKKVLSAEVARMQLVASRDPNRFGTLQSVEAKPADAYQEIRMQNAEDEDDAMEFKPYVVRRHSQFWFAQKCRQLAAEGKLSLFPKKTKLPVFDWALRYSPVRLVRLTYVASSCQEARVFQPDDVKVAGLVLEVPSLWSDGDPINCRNHA